MTDQTQILSETTPTYSNAEMSKPTQVEEGIKAIMCKAFNLEIEDLQRLLNESFPDEDLVQNSARIFLELGNMFTRPYPHDRGYQKNVRQPKLLGKNILRKGEGVEYRIKRLTRGHGFDQFTNKREH